MSESGVPLLEPGVEGQPRPSGPLGRIISILEASGGLIAGFCLITMFIALLVNVVLRYVLGEGLAWAYEIHAILFPWLVAGGVVIAAAQGRNIAVTILPDYLKGGGRTAVLLAINIAVVVISLSVLWSSQPVIKASRFQTLSTLGVVQTWGYASLVYAFGMMAILAVLDALSLLLHGTSTASGDPALKSLS